MSSKNKICTRCVMDTSYPGIEFDSGGICNYCNTAIARISNDLYVGERHQGKLKNLLLDIRKQGQNRKYDCLIGISGGADSSYTAYLVKRKLNLRPLAIHFDNGWNSELAVENIEKLVKNLDIDLITHVVDWEEFKDLQLAFLKASVPNSEIPTDHAISALMYKCASKYGIKWVIHGGNLATEIVSQGSWMHDAKDLRLIKAIHNRHGKMPLKTFPQMSYTRLAWYIFIKRIRYVGILNYFEYNKEQAMLILENEFGWRRYEEKHFESIYTRFFQSYLLPVKFKIDKRLPHLSSMIVSNQISREDAVVELAKPKYDIKVMERDIKYICLKFGLSNEEFQEILSAPVKDTSHYHNTLKLIKILQPLVNWIKKVATVRT